MSSLSLPLPSKELTLSPPLQVHLDRLAYRFDYLGLLVESLQSQACQAYVSLRPASQVSLLELQPTPSRPYSTTTTSAKKAASTTSIGVKAAATASSAEESSTTQVWTIVPTGTLSTRRSIAERLSALKRNIAARQRHARDFTSELNAEELFE